MKTYKIIRFDYESNDRVIDTGLSLEEAQEYCSQDYTSGDGWFCGYIQETEEEETEEETEA